MQRTVVLQTYLVVAALSLLPLPGVAMGQEALPRDFAKLLQSFRAGSTELPAVLETDANAYVGLLQVTAGVEPSGMLDRTTIRAINTYCVSKGIAEVCASGPLTLAAAEAIQSVVGVWAADAEPAGGTAKTLLQAQLLCTPSGGDQGLARTYEVYFDGATLSLSRGDRAEPYYEQWRGVVVNEALTVTGEYVEGEGGLKKIEFSLKSVPGRFSGGGVRGPRTCQVDIATPRGK